MKNPVRRRFAFCLLLALAMHLSLLPGLFLLQPQARVPTQRMLTATISTRPELQHNDSQVIASQAQRGVDERSQKARRQLTAAQQRQAGAADTHATQDRRDRVIARSQAAVDSRPQPDDAPASEAASDATATDEELTRSARSDLRAAYLEQWHQQMEAYGNRHYPHALLTAGVEQVLTMSVTLNAEGYIDAIHVVSTSGNQALDQAAIKMVRSAGPYPPLPPRLLSDDRRLSFAYDWVFSTTSGH